MLPCLTFKNGGSMNEVSAKRKLSAILSADIQGYSRLMGEDELETIRNLKRYQQIISSIVQKHNGRVVDSPGDNMLAEFSSAVDATECAINIQQDLQIRNDELSEDQRMRYRIGINLGEVIEDKGKIYGNGINIAARIEALADGGGICISRNVYEQVKNIMDLSCVDLGRQKLRNIKDDVKVYKIQMEDITSNFESSLRTIAVEQKPDIPLPERPSIAILPFTNMSSEKEQEYLSDGIAGNIITALSRTSEMNVIAQNSTFAYKGNPVYIQEVGKELGVRYVLEGSIQKSGKRIRINAQLIDAKDGHHIWAERFDQELKDIFELQDEITLKIIRALQVKLTRGDQVRLWEGGTQNLNAFETYHQAMDEYLRQGNLPQAVHLCKEAIKLDEQYIEPIVFLGWASLIEFWFKMSDTPDKSLEKAMVFAQNALDINDFHDMPHSLYGKILYTYRRYEYGIEEGERGVFLNPSGADACAHLGCILTFSGKPDKAFYWLEKAFSLNPMPPVFYYGYLGMANNVMEKYEEAIEAYKKALSISPKHFYSHVGLTESYSLLGREEEACQSAEDVKRMHPGYTADHHLYAMQYRYREDEERFLGALRKTGL